MFVGQCVEQLVLVQVARRWRCWGCWLNRLQCWQVGAILIRCIIHLIIGSGSRPGCGGCPGGSSTSIATALVAGACGRRGVLPLSFRKYCHPVLWIELVQSCTLMIHYIDLGEIVLVPHKNYTRLVLVHGLKMTILKPKCRNKELTEDSKILIECNVIATL